MWNIGCTMFCVKCTEVYANVPSAVACAHDCDIHCNFPIHIAQSESKWWMIAAHKSRAKEFEWCGDSLSARVDKRRCKRQTQWRITSPCWENYYDNTHPTFAPSPLGDNTRSQQTTCRQHVLRIEQSSCLTGVPPSTSSTRKTPTVESSRQPEAASARESEVIINDMDGCCKVMHMWTTPVI